MYATNFSIHALAMIAIGFASGCDSGTDDDSDNEQELITTINLSFTPGSGSPITAKFSDADGPGGAEPVITQPGPLAVGTTYALAVEFLNESESPAENITEEIMAEAEDHQIFFRGTAVGSILTVAYADKESDYTTTSVGADLPVGLKATVNATSSGTGVFQVTLKHQPPTNGQPIKTQTSGVEDGDTDADVSFNVMVQ